MRAIKDKYCDDGSVERMGDMYVHTSSNHRMPVFLVGKPGCSKSLAMQLIFANLRGRDSDDPHFKMLPQLLEFRYQCSEDSTSEGIRKVFERVKKAAAKASAMSEKWAMRRAVSRSATWAISGLKRGRPLAS